MKDKLTLRNALICGAALLAILVFIFSFLASVRWINAAQDWSYQHIVWGCDEVLNNATGKVTKLSAEGKFGASGLAVVGTIIVLIGGIGAVVVALVLKDEKIRKICLFVAAGLLVLGGIFSFFAIEGFYSEYAKQWGMTVEQLKKNIQNTNSEIRCALPIISGILAILAGGLVCASQFIADKKLVK